MSITSSCTYSNADPNADASIVATRNGNDFRFYGVIAGPGIEVNQTSTSVILSQTSDFTSLGKFVNMGNDIAINGVTNYFVDFNTSGPGQYDQIGTNIPMTTQYLVSILVSYTASEIEVVLYDPVTFVEYARAQNIYNGVLRRNSVSTSRVLTLNANQQLRLRIRTVSTNGTLFLSRSYLTISTG